MDGEAGGGTAIRSEAPGPRFSRPQSTISEAESVAFDAWLTALGRYRAAEPETEAASFLSSEVDRLWEIYERAADEARGQAG